MGTFMEDRVKQLLEKYKDRKEIPLDEPNILGLDWSKADLSGWKLSKCVLSNDLNNDTRAKFVRVDFRGATLNGVDFRGADLNRAKIGGAILDGAKFEGANLYYIRFENTNLIYADSFEKVKETNPCNARGTYTRLRRYFKMNGANSRAYDYYYREKLMETECHWLKTETKKRNWVGGIRNSLLYRVHGFGKKPYFILFWWVGIILIFGTIYWGYGGLTKDEGTVNIFENYYFSAVTFTTLGFGDIAPSSNNTCIQILVAIEASLGAFFVILLAITTSRKMFR